MFGNLEPENPKLDELQQIIQDLSPDDLTPKQAHELLYQLKKLAE